MNNLKYVPNGVPITHTFSDSEYEKRLAKLRTMMVDEGVNAILFTSIHNINYYSDFLYCAFGRPYGLLIDTDKSVSISANIDGGQPWRRTFGGENIVYTDWHHDNYLRAVQKMGL